MQEGIIMLRSVDESRAHELETVHGNVGRPRHAKGQRYVGPDAREIGLEVKVEADISVPPNLEPPAFRM